ncbi:MAG: PAS domain-containing protein, partial [Bacteroidales bacterium]|nr:PAS domain-containing protein [Bacteroidales bacterium]
MKKTGETSGIRSGRTATGSEPEDRYLTLTNQLPIGVYRTKVDGQFVYLNQALAKMLNYDTAEELMRLNVGQLYVNTIDRENQIEVAQNTSEVIQTEFQLRKKGGELIWVRDNSRLLFDEKGSPEYFDGILEDITERKQAEEALKDQERVYRTLFEGANDAILILKDGLFMNCNRMAVKLFGYNSKKELIGHSPWEFSPETQARGKDSREKATSLIEKAVSGTPQRFYWRHIRKGGEEFDAEVSLSRMDMDDNIYIQAILRDVTERKRSEQKLMSSEANLKAIIENSLESIWSVNTAYEIQYVNEVFASAFRETFGEQLRKGVNIINSLPESMRPLWKDRYDRVFNNEHFVFEDRIDMGDFCIYVEVSGNPIVVDSKVVGASFYGKDVTEKKLAEIELKKHAALRQILVELSSAYINLPLDQVEPEIYRSMGVIGNYIG